MSRIPKLRFKEFSSKWKNIFLEDIAIRGSGHTPNKKYNEYYNGGIKWISLADSNKLDNGYIKETTIEVSELGLNNSSAVLHPIGTVLLSRDAGVGKSAIMYEPMAVSQHFIVWKTKEELNNWFLYYKLQILKPEFERIAVGSTIKTIGLPYFKKLKINLPPKQEQEKIASFLTSTDIKIEQLTNKETLLKEYKKGVMQKIFNQEIRFKADDGSKFCEWEEKKIEDFLELPNNIKPNEIDKYKILTVKLHQNGILKSKNTESLSLGANYYIRRKGQFIYGKQNLFNGAFGIVPSEMDGFLSSSDVPALDFKIDKINPLFFNYYMGRKEFYNKLEIYASGTGSKRIHEKILLGLKVKFPSKEEQIKISFFLSLIDKKIENAKKELEKTKQFKKALLQQMFV